MKKAYVITEEKSGADILGKLLPENVINDTELIPGNGRSPARSLARSILAVRQVPVGLIVDADTNNTLNIREQAALLEECLDLASPGINFDVSLAVPEIEIVLFQDQYFIEKLAGRKFSDTEWRDARLTPKKSLCSIFNREEGKITEMILKNIDDNTADSLRKHPIVTDLCKFLFSVIIWY